MSTTAFDDQLNFDTPIPLPIPTFDDEQTVTENEEEDMAHSAGADVYEEILMLKQQLLKMESENSLIKLQLNTHKSLMSQMQSSILNEPSSGSGSGRPLKTRKLSHESRAKIAFYHDHKGDVAIVEKYQAHLTKALGLTKIPWQLVKADTDKMFEELTGDEKGMYMNRVM